MRHSVDVRAESSFDAAHLFLTTAKSHAPSVVPEPLPVPNLKTVFEGSPREASTQSPVRE
jgi:hypothetical protein